MTSEKHENAPPMARVAMAPYDQEDEDAFIKAMGQTAHPAQTNEAWQAAGICLFEDQTAVVQKPHYTTSDGRKTANGEAPNGQPTCPKRNAASGGSTTAHYRTGPPEKASGTTSTRR